MQKKLFILILLESLTLFCLSVLGDRVATLVSLPVPALLGLAALGIIITAILSYASQVPAEETHITLNDVWQRLRPRHRKKLIFGPRLPDAEEGRLAVTGFFLCVVLGIWNAFIRAYLVNKNLTEYWYIAIAVTILIASLPFIKIALHNTSGDSFLWRIGEVVLAMIGTFVMMLMWFGIGALLVFVVTSLFPALLEM
jgi:hypothetical protein